MRSAPTAAESTEDDEAPQPRRRIRRKWKFLGGLFGTVVLLVAFCWVFLFTSIFGVERVDVTGTKMLSQKAVLERASIRNGTPLLRLDTGEIEQRIAEFPQVESVRVERDWPTSVRIIVTERTPIAVVTKQGKQWLVDRHGLLYLPVAEAPGGVVPGGVVALDVAEPGSDDPATEAAVTVVASLQPDLRGTLARVTAPTPNSVTLMLSDGRTVIWGGAADSATKAKVLAALLTQPGTVYDVSSPDAAVVR